MQLKTSMKRIQIDKANSRAIAIIAVTTVITVFCLMSAKALVSQAAYQRKVINEKHKAVDQLRDNVEAAQSLAAQYEVFKKGNPNIIGGEGGADAGEGLSDGENPRIVLDALPSQYDFPALISSVEKIIENSKIDPEGIGGTDEGQDEASSKTSANPQPVPMVFNLNARGNYSSIQGLIKDLERSIRPMDMVTLELTGSSASMQANMNVTTYYQPGTSLVITEKEVK